MLIKRYRYPVAILLCILLSVFVASPRADYLTRLGGDFLIPYASNITATRATDESSPVALIVIDEVTHLTSPFSETPEVAWTPYLGEVITAVANADAKVIGLDMIFPKSISGRELLPGYDRSFLQALAATGREGKLVLSETRLSETQIKPYRGQEIAVGGPANIRPAHLTPDADNIIRRHPAWLSLENGERIHSLAAALSARAGAIPENDILINFTTPIEAFPTYRFSDLYRCLQDGELDVFNAFRNKTILIGTALDVEDRHVGANRLQRNKDFPVLSLPCGDERAAPEQTYRASTAGVFLEARATYTFITGSAPKRLSAYATFFLTFALTLIAAFAFFRLSPLYGFMLLAGGIAVIWLSGAHLLANQIVTPFLPWSLTASLLFVSIYSYRVILEDQSKRWVTHAFRHYLSPDLVNKLAEDPDSLKLGGERRKVAVLFADLAGFTTTSEELAHEPEIIAAHLNAFFEIMGANIESYQGYIDKYIGDAVMGVWGAPVDIENPEQRVVETAIACVDSVNAWNADPQHNIKMKMRIGISAGEVVAGNLGSKNRFNYTVIGDAVNRAARLEQENKRLKTQILFDGNIADNLPSDISVKFVEETTLRGQTAVTKLYTLDDGAQKNAPNDKGMDEKLL